MPSEPLGIDSGYTRRRLPLLPMAVPAIFSLVLLLGLFSYSARHPLAGNQIFNPLQAKFIAEEGRHYYRLNETAPVVYANFHSPLYVNFLAAAFLIGGVNSLSARAANLLLVLSVMVLMVALAVRTSGDRDTGMKVGFLAVTLYAVNPAILQSVLTTDPDGTVLNFAIILTVYLLVLDFGGRPSWKVAAVGIGFALAFWAKQTTPVFLAGLALVHAWISRGRYLTVPRLLLAMGLGVLLFGLSYVAYCWLTGLPPLYMVRYSLGLMRGEGGIGQWLMNLLYQIKIDFVWLNLFLVGAALLASEVWSGWRRGRGTGRDPSIVDVVGIGIFLVYFLIALSKAAILPRYKIPALSFLCLIIARRVVGFWNDEAGPIGFRSRLSLLWLGIPLQVALLVYYLFTLPDLALSTLGLTHAFQQQDWWALADRFRGPLLFIAPLALAFWAIRRSRGVGRRGALFFSLVFLIWPSELAVSIRYATAEYSTYMNHGQRGFKEVISYLKREENRGAAVIYNHVDLAFHVDNEVHFMTQAFANLLIPVTDPAARERTEIGRLMDLIACRKDLILIVGRMGRPSDWPVFWERASRFFEFSLRIGDFEIYRRKDRG